ncbi:hypothetical protein HaLaN_07365 [Haematococcus lacustris]|uniref:Uncharacterized protein n=1 Tax=Haematococcus lacustris TaxID=44745 RepID=A0A699YXR0_HAELA|nr:hypothetical protein HaLaN_07365 [Haematococcus lacustris]
MSYFCADRTFKDYYTHMPSCVRRSNITQKAQSPSTIDPSCQYLPAAHPSRPSCLPPPPSTASLPSFQQHARGADYSNTSAKEATRFTREQLRAYLLYHKVPPRDQPVGSTLVAGWQKAVQKHIAERGSPTGHGVLP